VRLLALLLAAAAVCSPAGARADDSVAADTLFTHAARTPISYLTTYDRDVSSGTWTQTLSYGLTRNRVAFSTNGSYTTIDLARTRGLGGGSGTFGGQLNVRAAKQWLFGLDGTFNKISSRDLVSKTSQEQNRLKLNTQYRVTPWRTMSLLAVASTEFQQDHGLTVRPLSPEQVREVPHRDANGDSIGVDSVFVHDQRDSTFMSGRQDGVTLQGDWKPKPWLQLTGDASGSRVRPVTKSNLRDFARAQDGSFLELVDRSRFESPNENQTFHTRVNFTGLRGLSTYLNLRRIHSDQQFFDKLLRNQEHLGVDQRGAVAHADYAVIRGGQLALDGTMDRSLNQYTLRSSRSSLITDRSFHTNFNYSPSWRSRGGIDFSMDHRRNERQSSGNGLTTSRSLQGSASHRASTRFGFDGTASVSLFSSKYESPILDQDNLRTYANLGAIYVVSERCSTTVHFSDTRGHIIAIDPSRSGNNNVQSTYQMDASLRLGVTPNLSIVQLYLINALYQIYDQAEADAKNVLSRIKRIDTTVTEALLPSVGLSVTHNFLFRDSGSFKRPPGGVGDRVYNVGSETYQQTLTATVNIKPVSGVLLSVAQSLGNTSTRLLSTDARTVDNRWNLTFGATVDRPVSDTGSLHGTVQHMGAYTERHNPGDPLRAQDDWVAGVSFQKDF
jgi:hypothetical protein